MKLAIRLKEKIFGYTLLLLAQTMVGGCIVGSKVLITHLPFAFVLTSRFVIAAIFLLILHLLTTRTLFQPLKKVTQVEWHFMIAQGLCAGFLFNSVMMWGLSYTSANIAGIIMCALPAVIILLSILFLKERLTFSTFICVCTAILGLIVINFDKFNLNDDNLWGDLIILMSLLPEASYYILSKIYKSTLPVFLLSSIMNAINIPFCILLMLFKSDVYSYELIILHWRPLILTGAGSALFYVFWHLGSKRISCNQSSLTTAFMPITTLAASWLFLNEAISLTQLAGMLLVMLSILFNANL